MDWVSYSTANLILIYLRQINRTRNRRFRLATDSSLTHFCQRYRNEKHLSSLAFFLAHLSTKSSRRAIAIDIYPSSVRPSVNNFFKQYLLDPFQNNFTDSSHYPVSKLLNRFRSTEQGGGGSKIEKQIRQHLLSSRWIDFKIIL